MFLFLYVLSWFISKYVVKVVGQNFVDNLTSRLDLYLLTDQTPAVQIIRYWTFKVLCVRISDVSTK